MSTMFSSGFVGVSTQISLVSARTARPSASRSVWSTMSYSSAEAREHLVHEPVGAAVEVLRQDHVVAGGAMRGEQRMRGGHAARERGAEATLQFSQRAFQCGASGIG